MNRTGSKHVHLWGSYRQSLWNTVTGASVIYCYVTKFPKTTWRKTRVLIYQLSPFLWSWVCTGSIGTACIHFKVLEASAGRPKVGSEIIQSLFHSHWWVCWWRQLVLTRSLAEVVNQNICLTFSQMEIWFPEQVSWKEKLGQSHISFMT